MDLLHAAAGGTEDVFQEAAADALAAGRRRDVDAPDVAAVAGLLAVERPEASDGDQAIAVEGPGHVEGLKRLGERLERRGRLGGEIGPAGLGRLLEAAEAQRAIRLGIRWKQLADRDGRGHQARLRRNSRIVPMHATGRCSGAKWVTPGSSTKRAPGRASAKWRAWTAL